MGKRKERMEANDGIGPLVQFHVALSLVPGTNCSLTFKAS